MKKTFILGFILFAMTITGCMSIRVTGKPEITDDENHGGHIAIQAEKAF